jgi:hypothetical protein
MTDFKEYPQKLTKVRFLNSMNIYRTTTTF